MGFGNAAGSFMTGFMSGYKFMTDIADKEAEKKLQIEKIENDLKDKKSKAAKELSDLRLSVIDSNNKANEGFIKEKSNISNPEEWVNTYSKLELDAKERRRTYNNLAINFASTFKDDSLKKDIFEDAPIQTLKVVQSKDGQKYIMNPSVSPLMQNFYDDYKNPETQRTFSIDEKGYLKLNNAYIDGGGNPTNSNTPDNNTAKLQLASTFMSSSNEKITSFTPFPVTAMSEEERKYFEKYPIVTYGDIDSYRKAKTGAKFFDAQVLYKGGKEISVSNKDDLDKMLQEGWSKQPPKEQTTGSIEVQQYNQYKASGGTKTFIEWKAESEERGKANALQGSLKSEEIGDTVKLTKVTPELQKKYSVASEKINSYQFLEDLIKTAEAGQKSGAFNQGFINTAWNKIIKYTPAEMQEKLSGKTSKQLQDEYSINAAAADFVSKYTLLMTGQAATDAQTQRYVETVIGSPYTNPQSAIFSLKGFRGAMKKQIDLDAKTFSGAGLTDFGRTWDDIKGGGKTVYSGGGEGGGQKPAKKSNIKPKWDPYLNKKGQ